jgi:hypothetical protein
VCSGEKHFGASFKGRVMTGEKLLAMVEGTALHHIPVGTVLSVQWCTTSLLSCLCLSEQGSFQTIE